MCHKRIPVWDALGKLGFLMPAFPVPAVVALYVERERHRLCGTYPCRRPAAGEAA